MADQVDSVSRIPTRYAEGEVVGGVQTYAEVVALQGTITADIITADLAGIPTSIGQKTMAASMGVTVASDQSPVPIGAKAVRLAPACTVDTGAMSVDDCLSPVLTLTGAARATGGSGRIVKTLVFDGLPGASVLFEVFFFTEAPASPVASNGAMAYSDADMAKCIGSILIPGSTIIGPTGSVTGRLYKSIEPLPFGTTTSANLFAQIILRAGTPTYGASDIVPSFLIEQD
jgi:hypothetical protein